MGRISLWLCVLFGALVGSQSPYCDASARSQELRISHQFPGEVDSRDRAARVFVAEAIKRAPHLRIAIHPGLSLNYKAPEQITALLNGELAMCIYTLADLTDRAPEFALTMMPFVPTDLDMAMRLKGTPFQHQLQSLAHANGLHILTWWWLPGGIASRPREIAGPPTVKGVGLRTPGPTLYGRLFAVAGGRTTGALASSSTAAALHDGTIDGILMSLESLVAFKTYEQVKFATFGGLGGFMSMQPLLISKMVWDGLTIDEQIAMEEAADVADQYFFEQQRQAERLAAEAFTKAGVKSHKLTMDEYEAWSRIAKETVWPEYRKVSPVADRLFVALLTSIIQSGKAVR